MRAYYRKCRRALVLSGEVSTWPLSVLFWALLDSSHGLLPPDLPCKKSIARIPNSLPIMKYSPTVT